VDRNRPTDKQSFPFAGLLTEATGPDVSDAATAFIDEKEVAMTNLYLRIRWRSAPLLGALLILTGVVGIFIPLMPEIAVILLGMWLVSAAAVTPLWRLRLAPQVGTQLDSSRRKRGLAMDTLLKQLRLHTFLGTALLFPIVLCGCQQKTPEPEKPTVAIENLHIAYTKEVNRQQKYAAFIKQAEKDRLPAVASLYRAVARSEEIHAANHARLLRSQGVAPIPPVRDSVIIGNSLQTLKMAMSDERAEVESL